MAEFYIRANENQVRNYIKKTKILIDPTCLNSHCKAGVADNIQTTSIAGGFD